MKSCITMYPGRLHILDPLDCLPLGVHHEGPATGARHDHAVLSREAVAWQTLDVPVTHVRWLGHELTEVKSWVTWDP